MNSRERTPRIHPPSRAGSSAMCRAMCSAMRLLSMRPISSRLPCAGLVTVALVCLLPFVPAGIVQGDFIPGDLVSVASAQEASGFADYLDWEGWARVETDIRTRLASSYDRSGGNFDANHYEWPTGAQYSNRPVTAATLHGPGIIYRFWMPHRTALLSYDLKMYFDGETTPRIDTSSDELLYANYSYFAPPLVTAFAGGLSSHETIPFRDSVRIDTENIAGQLHYYQYSYRVFPPGTDIESWDGTLDPVTASARAQVMGMWQNLGEHPAGESATAERVVVGPTVVPAGGALTLAELSSSGLVRRLNVRMDGATDRELESVRLRVFWDEEAEPSIDAPVGWFFGAGDNRGSYASLVMGTDSPDGFYCYWPMPFRHSARFELFNPLQVVVSIDSTVVEYEPGPVMYDMAYLHATARSDTVASPTQHYFDMAETEGTGHYVGNMLFLEQDYNDHWMLEGDDFIVVDEVDTIFGTGLEDAYNGGYYYNWVAQWTPEPEGPSPPYAFRPLHGILRVNKTADPPFSRADQYRWMIADRVHFNESLVVKNECDYSVVGARWKSVVYWYQLPVDPASVPIEDDLGGDTNGGAGSGPGSGSGSDAGSGPGNAHDAAGSGLQLRAIEPNPAGDRVLIRFEMPAAGRASLELLDVTGRKVAVLSEGARSAGVHEVHWNSADQPTGVYFVRLRGLQGREDTAQVSQASHASHALRAVQKKLLLVR